MTPEDENALKAQLQALEVLLQAVMAKNSRLTDINYSLNKQMNNLPRCAFEGIGSELFLGKNALELGSAFLDRGRRALQRNEMAFAYNTVTRRQRYLMRDKKRLTKKINSYKRKLGLPAGPKEPKSNLLLIQEELLSQLNIYVTDNLQSEL